MLRVCGDNMHTFCKVAYLIISASNTVRAAACLFEYGTMDTLSYLRLMRAQGEVVATDQRNQQCCVQYDSGEKAWLSLQQEHFRWLGPRAASAGSFPGMKVCLALPIGQQQEQLFLARACGGSYIQVGCAWGTRWRRKLFVSSACGNAGGDGGCKGAECGGSSAIGPAARAGHSPTSKRYRQSYNLPVQTPH